MFTNKIKSFLLTAIIMGISIVSTVLIVFADTDGTELRITDKPDQLVIQLGTDWAGAEFELKLDSGVFPVPIKVNSFGVITMELGGSKTYTLTYLQPVVVPIPENTTPSDSDDLETEINTEPPSLGAEKSKDIDITENEPEIEVDELLDIPISALPVVIFLSTLILAITGLLIMRAMKKRREYYENEDDYDYNDE